MSDVLEAATEVVDVAEISGGKAIVRLTATEAGLAALRADLQGKTYDLTKTRENEAARADRQRCVKLRTGLEARRKELKAPAVEFGRLIDAEAKRITDEVLKLEGPIDAAIKADEDRRERERQEKARIEAERVGKLQAGVATIRSYVVLAQAPGMTAERIARGMAALEAMAFAPEQWQEFADAAGLARDEALASLRVLHHGAVEREAEAVRLAAESERLEKERAELAAQAERLAAENRAREQAEREAAAKAADEEAARQAAQVSPPPTVPLSAAASPRQEEAGGVAVAPAYSEGQGAQQVLKAEPATADATDRAAHADASPRGGAMGAGQAAAAAPTGEPATLKLGAICERLGITMTAAFVADTLGVPHAATDKAARLYRETQFRQICRALAKHALEVAER